MIYAMGLLGYIIPVRGNVADAPEASLQAGRWASKAILLYKISHMLRNRKRKSFPEKF
jgi:hypothetical protein